MNLSVRLSHSTFETPLHRFGSALLLLCLLCGLFATSGPGEPIERIVVVDDKSFAPFAFLDASGEPRGLTIDLWRLWSEKTGVAVEFRLMEWDSALAAVREGRGDVVGGLFRTPEREAHFEFTSPLFQIQTGIFFNRQIAGLKGIEDLSGFRVGVVKGDSSEELLRSSNANLDLVVYPGVDDLVRAAVANEVKVFVVDAPVGQFYLAQMPGGNAFRLASDALIVSDQHAAVRKGNTQLFAVIQDGFDRISQKEIDAIVNQWSGRSLRPSVPWGRILTAAAVLLALILFFIYWTVLLRRRVAQATRDLQERNRQLALARDESLGSEQALRTTLDSISDAVIATDVDGRIVSMNPVAVTLTGWEIAAAVGKPLTAVVRIFDNESTESSEDACEQALTLGHCVDLPPQAVLEARDGTRHAVAGSAAPLQGTAEEAVGVVLVFRDETDRRQNEAALRESEERYRALAESSHDTIMRFDSEGRHLYVNSSAERETGLSPEAFIGKTHRELGFPEDLCELWDSAIRNVFATKAVGRSEFQLPNGHWIDWLLTPEFDRDGSVKAVIGSSRDITDRKHAEMERERLMEAVEQAGEMIVMTDAFGVIEYVNPAFERIAGYTWDDVIGQPTHFLRGLDHDDEFDEDVRRALCSGQVWKGRIDNVRKDGTPFTLEITISPVRDKAGGIAHSVSVSRDISRELAMEAQYRQAQKMESVGRLAGGVAHDFNNMLGVIIGYSDLILAQLDPGHPIYDRVAQIQKAASRSADLTRQLLAFARKQTVTPRTLDLNQTVSGMVSMLRRLLGEDIELTWEPQDDLWSVRMDPGQIDQILANLCVNARDAIEGVGHVTIETRNVSVDESYCSAYAECTPGDYVMLVVSDDGRGMDKATLENVFEPFYSTKGQGLSSGLGLATVYGIVKQNDGFINVYSESGVGTTFRIHLPRHAGETTESDAQDAEEMASRDQEWVLLVEDEPAILDVSKVMLEGLGYRVLPAASPEEALKLAEENAAEIRLLITDVIMPGMNGSELSGRVEALCPGIRILFTSGYTADVMAQRGMLPEDVQFLQKPFSMKAFAVKVREVLGATD